LNTFLCLTFSVGVGNPENCSIATAPAVDQIRFMVFAQVVAVSVLIGTLSKYYFDDQHISGPIGLPQHKTIYVVMLYAGQNLEC